MRDPTEIERRVEEEEKAVHAVIASWFRGDVPNDRDLFHRELEGRWRSTLVNIQPSGAVLPGAVVLSQMRDAHGANPAFEIRIADCSVREVMLSEARTLVLATYVEHQRGAKNTVPSNNTRVSTVVFEMSEDALTWLHIHETAQKP